MTRPAPRSVLLATRGISTHQDFMNLMGVLMADLVAGRVGPSVASGIARRASRELCHALALSRAARHG